MSPTRGKTVSPWQQDKFEDVWRREAPNVLGALVRRYDDLGDCEDAAQEALVAASREWPRTGLPGNPRAWLIRAASRRLLDQRRSESARAERERAWAADIAAVTADAAEHDDTLHLLLMCCHPVLTPASQVSLTLRAVGGLTTAQVASAFYVPEATMAQRISRAKRTLTDTGVRLGHVAKHELPDRVAAALRVLYLVFTEGHTSSGGGELVNVTLAAEAIRLTRALHARLPDHNEASGLLALMLLTDARRPARTDADGELVPLAEQDRSLWDRTAIAEGVAIVERALPKGPVGPYQLQAAIAAVHAESATWEATDWPQITALYRMLVEIEPGPAARLNMAVAVAMSKGPEAGLAELACLPDNSNVESQHRIHAVRAHLYEQSGDLDRSLAAYRTAARLCTSVREQRYLNVRAARLGRTLRSVEGRAVIALYAHVGRPQVTANDEDD